MGFNSSSRLPSFPLLINRLLSPLQLVISCHLGWLLSLGLHTARQQTQSSPSAMPWGFLTYRPAGSTRCPTTRTPSTSASTRTSLPSAVPSWIWCSSSSGKPSPLCTTTAPVRAATSFSGVHSLLPVLLRLFSSISLILLLLVNLSLLLFYAKKKKPKRYM